MELSGLWEGSIVKHCMVLVDHPNQTLVGMDNVSGVNRPCKKPDCEWEPSSAAHGAGGPCKVTPL
jgi:hypothetical protein